MANVLVVYGSTRKDRQGIKGAKFLVNHLKKRKHSVTLIEPFSHPFPLLDKMYKEYPKGKAPALFEKVAKLIKKADGVVVVSGEWNHSIPPGLTNIMDHYLEEWFFRPAAIATYSAGGFGGVRSTSQLRSFLGELGMPVISSEFAMSKVQDSFDETGKAIDPKLDKYVQNFLNELEWYMKVMTPARKKGTPY